MRRGTESLGQAPSQRQLKVAETMRHQLAEWLMRGELHDPALQGVSVTVSEVRASRDLKHATAYVAVLGADTAPLPVLDALNRAGPRLGGQLARALHLKYAPKVRFQNDDRYEEAARIETLLKAAHRDDGDGA
ncbi:MAG: 30S ribosome-binding factor RbfA [Geminicoccaceae bacterium]|nr:MAG: 30S ribosome-binding factor RbfA [Geminicoccaceae bacterium]